MAAEANRQQASPESHQLSSQQSQHSSQQSQHVQQVTSVPLESEYSLQGQGDGVAQRPLTCTREGGSQQFKRGQGSAEQPQGGYGGKYDLRTVRADIPLQQSCQPSNSEWHDPQNTKWRQQPSQHWPAEKKRQGTGAQRRLYKHGPTIPKSAAGQRPIRRRQRPEWDDHLTSGGPQTQGDPERGAAGGFSPRPTAKELLQEALARIQTAPSPRPQHAKRQRRGTAPEQAQLHAAAPQRQAIAADKLPQLQHAESNAIAANGSERSETTQHARRRSQMVTQHAKQSLVKQHAFGGKPSWISKEQPGCCAMQSAQPGDDTDLQSVLCKADALPFADTVLLQHSTIGTSTNILVAMT